MENARSLQKSAIDFDAIPDVFRTAIKISSAEEAKQVFEDASSQHHIVNGYRFESDHGMFDWIAGIGNYVSIEVEDGDIRFYYDEPEYYKNEGFRIVDFAELPRIGDEICESESDLSVLFGGV